MIHIQQIIPWKKNIGAKDNFVTGRLHGYKSSQMCAGDSRLRLNLIFTNDSPQNVSAVGPPSGNQPYNEEHLKSTGGHLHGSISDII